MGIDAMNARRKREEAQKATKEAIHALGMAVYESEKDAEGSYYTANIKAIKKCLDNEKLWNQYILSLDGKIQCDKCGAIITSDSAFCNKCGTPIEKLDFISLGVEEKDSNAEDTQPNVCPKCGNPLVDDAVFCEKCGTKIGESGDSSSSEAKTTPSRVVCPTCGNVVDEDEAFCEKCGTRVRSLA